MLLRRLYYGKLAQASYMIGCQASGEAMVVDPHRDSDVYTRAASDDGMRIRFVSETHIHADYLSGSRQLASRTGAQLVLSGEGGEGWRYGFAQADGAWVVRGGDRITLGRVSLDVLHTPGHTPEHISFLVTDGAASDRPLGLLTGDFVFVGDVGRPDLLEKAAGVVHTMEESARTLYRSLQGLSELPDYLQILPGHGAGSACGKAPGAVPTSTLGYERLVNWAFQCAEEDEFVSQVLADQPEPPRYFTTMKRLNRDGPPVLEALPEPTRMPPESLVAVVDSGGLVVDTRPIDRFADGHVGGTLNLPLSGAFPGMAGWLLPYDRPIHLIASGEAEAREAARDLSLIGIDDVRGYFDDETLATWQDRGHALERSPTVEWDAVEDALGSGDGVLLDVRGKAEWNAGHVPGAGHVHFGSLGDRLAELPRDRPVILYCEIGSRSAVGASVLRALGVPDVKSVRGGLRARRPLGSGVVTP